MSPQAPQDHIVTLNNMYQDYFLDYASYVILERAIPSVTDGLKPVQRRILHALYSMDDGRYHKVANVIGQTMQYHPHGDAAIGEALINLGQKELAIDPQGNWGDNRTGDSAAASRYIEARLTKFALEVAFNPQTTEWQLSYDGRKKEPIALPMKFPLLLAQGVEGIAVGLATKILPHNFIELIQGSIKILKGKKVEIFPDFETGGSIDVSEYNQGLRGSKVKIRSKIEIEDKKTLVIKEIPYGITTTTLIDSIVKAADKGKIKIKTVTDHTAKDVAIRIELLPGISPEQAIDALYAFTNCEFSISPNACVIVNDKPEFLKVNEILRINTFHTQDLLGRELAIKKAEILEKWHLTSLEKIFIENRIYRDIEECTSFEQVLEVIDLGLKKYVVTPSMQPKASDKRLRLMRDISRDDLLHLTEIKIKRISKYNKFQTDEAIKNLEQELKEVQHNIDNLTDYTIQYFEHLLQKYGKGRERKTILTNFESIVATEVVAINSKLFVNREDGFIGHGLKKDEFVKECSDLDDIIVFRADGKMLVSRISEKTFVGKDIIHVDVWKKQDERTTYNMIYLDGETGRAMAKRFNVTAITRDKEYDLTKGHPKSKCLYFTANPEGEAEIVSVFLSAGCKAKIKQFDFDFKELEIKGRSANGNIITKYPIRKVVLKEKGESTLGAQRRWYDPYSGKLNSEEKGKFIGNFNKGDLVLVLYKNGNYEINDFELTNRYDPNAILQIEKYKESTIISAVYFDGEKEWTMAKRFTIETLSLNQKFCFISENKNSQLYYAGTSTEPVVLVSYKKKKETISEEIDLNEFIDVKGWKALGNKIVEGKLSGIEFAGLRTDPSKEETSSPELFEKPNSGAKANKDKSKPGSSPKNKSKGGLKAGDTIEW